MPTREEDSVEIWRRYESGLTISHYVQQEERFADREDIPTKVVPHPYVRIDAPSATIDFRYSRFEWRESRPPRRARLCDAVFSAAEVVDLCGDPECVPTALAALGKPYIATYLAGVYGEADETIATRLDVSKRSVQQYVSDVVSGRR